MTATALWFGPQERPLFGWLHTPDRGGMDEMGSSRAAVVLCPPLGVELHNAYYALRLLAKELEALGLTVVRFDYDGVGNSFGDAQDPDRIESWIQSIEQAAALARSHGAGSIALVGLRMGSLLAEFAAARIEDLKAMVLWDPYVSARGFVRQQRALERLRLASSPESTPYDGAPGGWLDARTLDALKRLGAPPARTQVALPVADTLVLHRPGDGTVAALLERLDQTSTMAYAIDGQPEFLDAGPLERIIPRTTITQIGDWLARTLGPGRVARPASSTTDPALEGRRVSAAGTVSEHRQTWLTAGETAVMAARSDFGPVSERIVKLGDLGLFGIETRAENADPSLPAVVFLNAGKDSHVGPHRIWVKWARQWAALGFRCVRFDLSGLADSPVRPGQEPDTAGAPEAFDDLADAARAISPADPTNIVWVGLCSGGYQAFDSGLALKPRGILAVNPMFAFTPPETADGPIDPRRQACLPTTSATLQTYRRYVPAWLHRSVRPFGWWVRRLLASGQSGSGWVDALMDDGVRAFCICSEDEVHQLPSNARQAPARIDSGGSFRVQSLPNLEHSLAPPPDQERAGALFTAYLLENFPPRNRATRTGGDLRSAEPRPARIDPASGRASSRSMSSRPAAEHAPTVSLT